MNTEQGTVVVAATNLTCGAVFGLWRYPGGGDPFKELQIEAFGGEAVSIAP